jgi:pimeloyl-ACP methyl ester carboxylesterase
VGALSSRIVRTARGPVEVASTGEGPALLVVHGIAGDWRQARTVAEDLSPHARVLLVTRPGYGRTPLSSGGTALEQAALYRAALDSLGVERAVVLGISGGGPSAYSFAAISPDRCAGLLLCCAVRSAASEEPAVMAGMRRLAAVPGVWSALATTARAITAVRRAAGREGAPDLTGLTPVEREQLDRSEVLAALVRFEQDRGRMLRGRGLRNDTRQFAAVPPVWPDGIAVPTAVLHGDADEVVPVSHAHDYAAAVPGAQLHVLPGLGHVVPLFARELLADELRALLKSEMTAPEPTRP